MDKLIVDRIEEGIVVCENSMGESIILENPPACKEGDCLILTEQGYIVDEKETNNRKEKIQSLFDRLKNK